LLRFGHKFAKIPAARLAAFFMVASLRLGTKFQTSAACLTKVLHPLAGTLMCLGALALDGLVRGFVGMVGKRTFPAGLWDPFGPSTLFLAFQISVATALTTILLYEGILALAIRVATRTCAVFGVWVSVLATLFRETCILRSIPLVGASSDRRGFARAAKAWDAFRGPGPAPIASGTVPVSAGCGGTFSL
jgi:hypothetical protein